MTERPSLIEKAQRFLCRAGFHRWSVNRGGIQICTREHCKSARTYGLTGTMRYLEWEESLYEDYQRFTEDDDDA